MVEKSDRRPRLLPCTSRAGRGLVDWTQEDLAIASGVSRSTVREFENGHHELHRASEEAIVGAFEHAGVRLIAEHEGGPGVRLVARSGRTG